MQMKEYTTASGELLLYQGNPDFTRLDELANGAGDIWHSALDQGYRDAFPELVYQTAVFWWYINDFKNEARSISWRINPEAFVVRKTVWDSIGGFDADYSSKLLQALEFGYQCLRNGGAIPLYIKGLFEGNSNPVSLISATDRYMFFRKNFKIEHSFFMLYRQGLWRFNEWQGFFKARKYNLKPTVKSIEVRELRPLEGKPTVSYIIPTMLRQDFTERLIDDLSRQSYPPTQVVVVDATPEEKRSSQAYQKKNYPFELIIHWQETKGSCRARNEAIAHCNGDYFIFGDDDICIPDDFVEKHIRILQTYQTGACNGLDIRADHPEQNLTDLSCKLEALGSSRWKVGATPNYSNANSCVKKEWVDQLVGNDINFDGGYGEDSDFGLSLAKLGVTVLFNPFSANLHLKPAIGGYRWWGAQAKVKGKKRKKQPWELDIPVDMIRPVPSPTVMYGIIKHFTPQQLIEYKHKYFFLYLFKGAKWSLIYRFLNFPYKNLQFKRSVFYAKKLMELGVRHQ